MKIFRDAWYCQRGLSRTEAKRRYVTTLINTMHLYASQTAEARELVAELEFVWDQVKANAVSSSSTSSSASPGQRPAAPVVSSSSTAAKRYGSIQDRLTRSAPVESFDQDSDLAIYRRRSGDSRLRVLSPVSQSEEADVARSNSARNRDNMDDDDDDDNNNNNNDDEDDDEDDEDEEFQEARDGTSISSERSQFQTENEASEDRHHRSSSSKRRKRQRKRTETDDWRHRIEQGLTKMTTELAALREQLDSLNLPHHHSYSSNKNYNHNYSSRAGAFYNNRITRFFMWLISWTRRLLYHAFRQLLWHIFVLGVLLVYLRLKGDTRLEGRVIGLLLQIRARLINLLRMVPRRLQTMLRLPLLP